MGIDDDMPTEEQGEPSAQGVETQDISREFKGLLFRYGYALQGKNEQGLLYSDGQKTLLISYDDPNVVGNYVKIQNGNNFEPAVDGWGDVTPQEFEKGFLEKEGTKAQKEYDEMLLKYGFEALEPDQEGRYYVSPNGEVLLKIAKNGEATKWDSGFNRYITIEQGWTPIMASELERGYLLKNRKEWEPKPKRENPYKK